MEEPRVSGRLLSPHLVSLAGLDLVDANPPLVRVEEVREVAVVVSRSRHPRREIHLEACQRDDVPIIVRPSGGGAVVLAPGMLVASVLARRRQDERFPEQVFRRFCRALSVVLGESGVSEVATRGVSDLCVNERKVAGSALRLWRERVLLQVSLLVEADVGLFERYLALPSRMPDYRAGRSHRDFVINLREAGLKVSAHQLCGAVHEALHRESFVVSRRVARLPGGV